MGLLALLTKGYTGADLEGLVGEANRRSFARFEEAQRLEKGEKEKAYAKKIYMLDFSVPSSPRKNKSLIHQATNCLRIALDSLFKSK